MFRAKNTSPERFKFFFLSSHHTTGTYFQKYRTATFAMPPNDAPCLLLFPSERRLLKRANRAQGTITASFFTVANKKWRSIELSQISHFRVIQSEIWVRDYDLPKPVGKILECLSLKLQCSLLHLLLSNTEGNVTQSPQTFLESSLDGRH